MENIDELMRTTRRAYDLPRLRWGYVSPHQGLCIGFTTNPTNTGVTIVHLAGEPHTTIEAVPDDTLEGIYWLTITQTSGIILYQWREPVTHLHDAFVGRSGDPLRKNVRDGYEITRNWLAKRESTLRRLLNTRLPLKLIKKIVLVTGPMLALDAIYASSTLLTECNRNPEAMRQKVRQLSRLSHHNVTQARQILPGRGKYNDMQLKTLIRGMTIIADSLA